MDSVELCESMAPQFLKGDEMTNIEKVIVNSRYGMPNVTNQMVTNLLVNQVLNELNADPYSDLLITEKFCKIKTSKGQLELALKRTLEKCWPYVALLLGGMKYEQYL